MTVKPNGGTSDKADIDWTMAAAGMRSTLAEPGEGGTGAQRLGRERDASTARARSGLAHCTQRQRHFAPRLETGIRHDGGDAETGFGVEFGGALTWSHLRSGISFDLEGRTLLTHEDDAIADRGFSAGLVFDPNPASERGLSFTLRHTLGTTSSGGLDALFTPDAVSERASAQITGRWTVEAAWVFPAFGGRYTGSPHAGLGLTNTTRNFSIGWRLAPGAGPGTPDLSLGILATRRESEGTEPEHRIGIEAGARW